MPENENASAGKALAVTGLSANGNHAQPHSTMIFEPGARAIWHSADHDQPVTITGLLGEQGGVRLYSVEGSDTGIPEHELLLAPGNLMSELTTLLEKSRVQRLPMSQTEPKSEELTEFLLSAGQSDEGNAQCVNRLYRGRFLYSEALGWLAFTGTHWATEGAEQALERATVDTLIRRIEAASAGENFEKYEKLRKFCLPNKSRVEGAKHLLSSLVHVLPAAFDNEPDMLNCRNGVVNLRTGALSPHDPTQRFMHCTSVDYKPAADQQVWQEWLLDAVRDATAADWLQLAVGYSLTGHTREEILIYLFGPPRAGKGAFTETLLAMLGSPLAKEINFGTFTAQRTGDTQNFDLAPLKPCRLVAASESNAYERFNEAKVKAITGGNEIYCAFKHREHFNYRPQFKVWLSSNQPVNADPDDDAVWGRVRLIHFPNSHQGREDKLLKQRLRSLNVLEGVLAWAVQGAMRWYELGSRGLSEPASSLALKQQHRETLDAVGMWLEEHCERGDQHFTGGGELYQSYERWCRGNGVEAKRQKGFTMALQRKGFRYDRQRVGSKVVRGFFGLRATD